MKPLPESTEDGSLCATEQTGMIAHIQNTFKKGNSMNKIFSLLGNGERYQTIAVVICVVLTFSYFGCQPTVDSMLTPGKQITSFELDAEVEFFLRTAEMKATDLQQRQKIQDLLFQTALITARTGAFSYLPIITGLGTILGIGATVDNVRKRKEIKFLKTVP